MILVDAKGEIDINENLRLTSAQVREGQIREITQYVMDLKTRSAQKLNARVEPGGFDELQDGLYYEFANAGDDQVYVVFGDKADFAKVYEFGLQKAELIRAHSRRIKEVFGRPVKAGFETISVKEYSRDVDMGPHPFIYASLKEMETLKAKLFEMLKPITDVEL
jgi:hypothetical protein